MTLQIYLRIAILMVAIDAVVLTYLYSMTIGEDPVRYYLVAKGALDLAFIVSNRNSISLDRFEIFLLCVLGLHATAGLVVMPIFSSAHDPGRALNDLVWPVFFVTKVVIFRQLVISGALVVKDIKFIVFSSIVFSLIQIFIFFVFGSGAYAGITPPVTLPLAYALAFGNPWLIIIATVTILFSGKRSFLVGAIAAVGVRALLQRRNRVFFLALTVGAILTVALAAAGAMTGLIPQDILWKAQASFKIFELISIVSRDGFGSLFDETVRMDLYVATAGRSEEFYSILSVMQWYNVFVGLGAGFTYSYLHWEGWVDGHANSHFSPLALTYKFGLVYAICIYVYIFKGLLNLLRSKDRLNCMVGFGLVMFLVQSLFAFNLFVELFLPFLVALRQVSENAGRRRSLISRQWSSAVAPARFQVAPAGDVR